MTPGGDIALERLRSVCADLTASQAEVQQAVALALWEGATPSQTTLVVGHWPRLPDPLPDDDPIWYHLS